MTVPRTRGSWRWLVAALSLVGLVVAMLSALPTQADVGAADPPGDQVQLAKIDRELGPDLKRATADGDRVEAVVILADDPGTPSESPARRVATNLRSSARSSQSPVVDAIRDSGDQVLNTFWINNMILARLQPETLRELTAFDRVERIIPNFSVSTTSSPSPAAPTQQAEGESTWGIEKIGADDIHSELGVTGTGVRVAVLDTGVDASHPDIAGKLATDDPADPAYPGGWMEFSETGEPIPSAPYDSEAHGTHVSGTVVGGNASGTQIGVAPGAALMAGLVLPAGTGSFAQVVAGMQWALAPFDAEGNPAGAPADVVNMSLGAEGHFSEFIEPTRNMYLAGIFPAFSIGNNCAPDSSNTPGNVYEAFSVGATDSDDNVAPFSCGEVVHKSDWVDPPAEWPDTFVAPDVSAPGVDVISALPGGSYGPNSGTSMATPHVAGTVALMLEAEPDISVDEAADALAGTSVWDDRHGAERPNARFGWGRIDAYAAVTEAALDSGVTGTVTDAGSGQPLAGAVVTRLDTGRTTRTDEAGRFEMRMPAGTYGLEVSQFGYEVRTVDGIVVAADGFTQVDAALTLLPRGVIRGKVTYGPTGSTVPGATVEVLDVPVELSATTTRDGTFTIRDVPEGDYQVAASAPGLPHSESADVRVSSAQSSQRPHLVLPERVRMSVGTHGAEGDDFSVDPSVTSDGRYVAFYSVASNLVPGDTNGNDCGMLRPCGHDVFVHDRFTGETERVSLASDGTEGNLGSSAPSISQDGRYVTFMSAASNLVPGDTNQQIDVFVHDRVTGETERVSVGSDGAEGNDQSSSPVISDDGRYVAFSSWASTLVEGDTNGQGDVFVHDRWRGDTERVSITTDGGESDSEAAFPSISADGRYVAFDSSASNLVAGDTNGQTDVFVHDRRNETTERVSIATDGTQGTRRASSAPAISGDGRYVAFQSGAAELVPGDTNSRSDIFIRDRRNRTTERVSVAADGVQGNDNSSDASFSADARFLVFTSGATNLVAGDINGQDDVFVLDRREDTIERSSEAVDGDATAFGASGGAISDDGRIVAFHTNASTVEAGDTNQTLDVFVHDRRPWAPAVRLAYSDLDVSPSVVRSGHDATVSAELKNIGDLKGRFVAVLRVDGEVADRESLSVQPGRTEDTRFKVRRWEPGTYQVAIGPLTGELIVRPR